MAGELPIQSADATSAPASTRCQQRQKRVVFRLMAIALGLLPLLVVELGLRAWGVGGTQRYHDPLVGFSQLHPLFERDAAEGMYRTSRSRELFFGVQEFDAVKADNEFRIFCLGGSTVRGRPYETDTAFAQWLEMELSACDPARVYKVINCGGLSYASYRLRIMLDEVLQYQPDMIIVATGHNEFLEDRTYGRWKHRSAAWQAVTDVAGSLRTVVVARQLLESSSLGSKTSWGRTVLGDTVKARLDDATGYASYHRDDAWRSAVVAHFERSVVSMIEACKSADVPLMLVNLGSNLRGTPPFKSEHTAGLSAADQLRWQQRFDDASGIDGSDPQQALERYQQAAEIDDRYALLSFRIARCLDRLERYDEARQYYRKAKDDDVCPLRMLDSMYVRQQELARNSGTPIVDARRLLEERSAQGIAGDDWYTDHVHPTLDGHQQIAQQIAATMRQRRWPAPLAEWDPQQRRQAYQQHLRRLGNNYRIKGKERVGWLEGWARTQRLFHEALPVEARGNLHRGFRRYGFGDTEQAWEDFQMALREEPSLADDLLQFAVRLMQQGEPHEAQAVAERLSQHPASKTIEQQDALNALRSAGQASNLSP